MHTESGCDNPMKELNWGLRGMQSGHGTRGHGHSSMQLGGNWKPLTVDKRKKTITILTQQRHRVAWRKAELNCSYISIFISLSSILPGRNPELCCVACQWQADPRYCCYCCCCYHSFAALGWFPAITDRVCNRQIAQTFLIRIKTDDLMELALSVASILATKFSMKL